MDQINGHEQTEKGKDLHISLFIKVFPVDTAVLNSLVIAATQTECGDRHKHVYKVREGIFHHAVKNASDIVIIIGHHMHRHDADTGDHFQPLKSTVLFHFFNSIQI